MPGVQLNVAEEPRIDGVAPDLTIDVTYLGRRYLLLVEVKTLASRRALLQTAQGLEALAPALDVATEHLGVLGVPHIGPALSRECRRLGIGYVDTAGNAHLALGPIYIDVSGLRSKPREHALVSVFAPKSSRIVRALLAQATGVATQAELVELTGISHALASRVVGLLTSEGLVEREGLGIKCADPSALLDLWVDSYRTRRIRWDTWHVAHEDSLALARLISSLLNRADVPAVFTGLLPASLQAPYVISDMLHLYADDGYEDALREAGARPVTGAGALRVNSPPWDEGVSMLASKHEDVPMAHPVQVYLDLTRLRGRGEEAATVYRERVLGY